MKKNGRGILALSVRLFKMAAPVKGLLTVSTLSSILGNLSHVGLLGFGALLILRCAGLTGGSPVSWGGLVFVCSVSIVINRYVEGVVSHAGAYRLLCDMRVNMYETLRRLAPARLVDRQKGDILSVAVSDIETIEFFFAHTIGPLFTVVLLPALTLVIAGLNHPLFAAILLPVYVIVSGVLPLTALQAGRKIGMDYREAVGRLKSLILESVYGLKEIQIFGAGRAELEKVKAQTRRINRAAHFMTLHRQIVSSTPVFFIYLARIAVAAAAAYLAASGTSDPAGVIALSFVVSASFSSTQSLTTVISSLIETYAAAGRIFDIEDMTPAVEEKPEALVIDRIEQIVFQDVSFAYAPGGELILSRVNLTLNRGETLGLMGESGIGKSTVIRLLLRFWEVTGGVILINGIPLGDISLNSLRNRIAMLEQDTFIFDDTIGANIALGKPDASKEAVIQAARQAGIHDFIETLPEGYETPMGELGGRLSGGERQRIGIARTLLRNPDVLVMDEPTSSLDVLAEKALLRTLADIGGGMAVLLVSHRPSTLTGCTRIAELRDGKITEAGSPAPRPPLAMLEHTGPVHATQKNLTAAAGGGVAGVEPPQGG